MNVQEKAFLARRAAEARVTVLRAVEDFVERARRKTVFADLDPYIAEILSWDNRMISREIERHHQVKTELRIDLAKVPDPDVIDPTCDHCGERHDPVEPCEVDGAPEDWSAPGQPDDHRADAARYVPPPRETKAERPKIERKTGPWSDDEVADALELDARGKTTREIADALGRDARGVSAKLRFAKAAAEAEAEAEDDDDDEADDSPPEVGNPTTEAPPVTIAPPPNASVADKQVHFHLDRLGNEDPFTPQVDARLAKMLAAGDGVPAVREALSLTRDQVIDRWNALLPEKGFENQVRLVNALEYRASVHAALTTEAAE